LRGLSGLNAPDLRLLELDNNRIKSLEGLQGWNAHNLDELVLYSNPIEVTMTYEDRKRFPFIEAKSR
jgi:Leucine-rich repeat (LRR) protein